MSSIVGRIVLAQESRFKVVTRNGQTKLFLLAANSPHEPQDLVKLVGQDSVRIEFFRLPGRIGALAHRIKQVRSL